MQFPGTINPFPDDNILQLVETGPIFIKQLALTDPLNSRFPKFVELPGLQRHPGHSTFPNTGPELPNSVLPGNDLRIGWEDLDIIGMTGSVPIKVTGGKGIGKLIVGGTNISKYIAHGKNSFIRLLDAES
ncbi:MAG: hypothetical protein VCD00_12230 [Candidatus Hydrogenedentota bacterium]